MAEHYYTVGVHGAPTKETAPHGFRWRAATGQRWFYGDFADIPANANDQWDPLPAPPTEEAPAPEPVARWGIWTGGETSAVLMMNRGTRLPLDEAQAAAATLNTLEADGVVWGPGRPPSGLAIGDNPDVLVQTVRGEVLIRTAAHVRNRAKEYVGWWPLPGEAQ